MVRGIELNAYRHAVIYRVPIPFNRKVFNLWASSYSSVQHGLNPAVLRGSVECLIASASFEFCQDIIHVEFDRAFANK
jgi:hypothetical protein